MAAASDFLENEILDHVLRAATWTPPATVYLALFTASNGLESNSPTGEVSTSSTGYARQAITFDVASGGTTQNSALVTFPEATGNWGNISHFALMDASTGGNVLIWGQLDNAKTVSTGDNSQWSAGALTVTLA